MWRVRDSCMRRRPLRQRRGPRVQRTYTDLILCDDSTDSLLLEQAADESLRITLRHDPTVGNLNVTIRTDEAEDLGTSNNVYGVEVIEIEQAGGDRQLNIVIAGDAGFDVPYQLTVERLAADACLSDEYEGLLGNDDVDRDASDSGSLTHNICQMLIGSPTISRPVLI